MGKKEIVYRPMFGFGGGGGGGGSSGTATGKNPLFIKGPKVDFHGGGGGNKPIPKAGAMSVANDKDAIIAELRTKIEELEARETKRLAQTRERTRKARAKS